MKPHELDYLALAVRRSFDAATNDDQIIGSFRTLGYIAAALRANIGEDAGEEFFNAVTKEGLRK